jgi:superfamily I DNA and RNA helicase
MDKMTKKTGRPGIEGWQELSGAVGSGKTEISLLKLSELLGGRGKRDRKDNTVGLKSK